MVYKLCYAPRRFLFYNCNIIISIMVIHVTHIIVKKDDRNIMIGVQTKKVSSDWP